MLNPLNSPLLFPVVFVNNPEPNNPPVVVVAPDPLVEAMFAKSPVPVLFPNRLFDWELPNRLPF